jgi:hypothetical protein
MAAKIGCAMTQLAIIEKMVCLGSETVTARLVWEETIRLNLGSPIFAVSRTSTLIHLAVNLLRNHHALPGL